MEKDIYFKYEQLSTMEAVHEAIKRCEGVHSQQIAFSSFHDALTQICFGCGVVRSTIFRGENKKEKHEKTNR